MENMTARQGDVDRRLRDLTGRGLVDWLTVQRATGASFGVMSRKLYDLTGLSVSYESLRQWAKAFGVTKPEDVAA